MTRRFLAIIGIVVLVLVPLVGCMDEGAAPPTSGLTVDQVMAKADANAAIATALQGRVAALESRATGEVTAAQHTALAQKVTELETTIAELEAEIEALQDSGDMPGDSGDGSIYVSETRWQPIVSLYSSASISDDLALSFSNIDPRPIREADNYLFEVTINNPTGATITDNSVYVTITLTPVEKVKVSKYIDVYSDDLSYLWWDAVVTTHPTEGYCRRIQLRSDSFKIDLAAGGSKVVKVRFDLIYE